MQAALAAQLLQLRPRDLLTQTAVMLANQAAIRIGMASPEHADREQAREAIDALAGVIELLAPTAEPDELEALRRDLAQLRMAFVQSGEPAAPPPAAESRRPEDEGPARSARRSGLRAARSDQACIDLGSSADVRGGSRRLPGRRGTRAGGRRPSTWRSHKHARIRRM